ncbi:MAG: ABC transporter substrate-binding protein [Hamadaea sp.]|nr:ABC transporter substrate-binding protein [Hamadaea sp.]
MARLRRLSTVMTLATLLAATGCTSPLAADQPDDLVIGADLELSGAYAEMGTAFERALRLRVDQLNAANDRQIRVVYRDNRSDKSLSQSNIAGLAADSEISAIITGACGECAIASAAAVAQRGVPLISLAGADEVADADKAGKFIFKVGPNAKDGAAAVAAQLTGKSAKVAVIATDDAYGDDGVDALTVALTNADATITTTRRVATTATEFSQTVDAALEGKPDALVVWTGASVAGEIAVEARKADFDGRLLFDTGAGGNLFFDKDTATAAEGALMAFPQTMVIDEVVATNPAKSFRQQWFRDYTASYGGYSGYASYAADALELVVAAVDRTDSTSRGSVRDALDFMQLDGFTGPLSLRPDDHSAVMPQALALLVVRDGRWRLAS